MMVPLVAALAGLLGYAAVELDHRYLHPRRVRARRAALTADALRRLRALSPEELRGAIETDPYFDLRIEGSARLRDTPGVRRFLLAVCGGAFEVGRERIEASLNLFVAAERELGNVGRPLLVDYDLQLCALLQALRESSSPRSQ